MSAERAQFQTLLSRASLGDQQAACELVEVFGPHVRRVVRRHLPDTLRSKFDSMDFVQSVWGDFFSKLNRQEIGFQNPEQLARFLSLAAKGKVMNETRRRLNTGKHSLIREKPLEACAGAPPLTSRDPTPSQAAILRERWLELLKGRPKLHRIILALRHGGYTFPEIAAKTGVDERSARRIVESIERQLGLGNGGQ